MSDEPDNLILALLRKVDARLGRIESDITDIRGRLQRLESRSVRTGELDNDNMRIDHRLDKLEDAAAPVG